MLENELRMRQEHGLQLAQRVGFGFCSCINRCQKMLPNPSNCGSPDGILGWKVAKQPTLANASGVGNCLRRNCLGRLVLGQLKRGGYDLLAPNL